MEYPKKPTLGNRKDSDFVVDDVEMPMKDELLYEDQDCDLKEYEDFIIING